MALQWCFSCHLLSSGFSGLQLDGVSSAASGVLCGSAGVGGFGGGGGLLVAFRHYDPLNQVPPEHLAVLELLGLD